MPKSPVDVSSTTASTSASLTNSYQQPRLGSYDIEDWLTPNEFANVALKVREQKVYFIFEILALNSEYFYNFWEDFKKSEEKEKDIFEIELDDMMEFDTLVLVLKNLETRDKSWLNKENLQSVLYLAKCLKLEMILKMCESRLVTNGANRVQMLTIAHQYDMNELEHRHLSETEPFKQAEPTSIKFVSSAPFKMPEMETNYKFRHNFVIDRKKNNRWNFDFTALIGWKIEWTFVQPSKLTFTLKPALYDGWNEQDYKSLNWLISIDFKLAICRSRSEPKQTQMIYKAGSIIKSSFTTLTFNTDQQKIELAYDIWMKVRKIRGLRYYVQPHSLFNFKLRHPSSDIVIQTKKGRLFANLNILAFHSLYFQGTKDHLSTVPIDETTNLPIVKIEDVETKDFVELLKIIYPSHINFDLDDFVRLSPIIDRFLFCGLVKDCEQLQIDAKFPLGVRTLQLGLDYKMERLQEKYLAQFDSASKIHTLSADTAYKELSDTAKLLLHDRLMSLPLLDEKD